MKNSRRDAIAKDDGSKLHQKLSDYTAAWDERKRAFDALRNPDQTDDERQAALDEYLAATKHFDELRNRLAHK